MLLVLAALMVRAQDVVVQGQFQSDSLLIGQPVPFSVTASYPRDLQILFPDSTYNFQPYELAERKYFATKTSGEISRDSVVYYLTSFEIDSIQVFQLPVFVVQAADCTQVSSRPDSIFLKQFVAAVPDSVEARALPLKTNTEYLAVSWMLDYPVLIVGVGILLVTALIVCWLRNSLTGFDLMQPAGIGDNLPDCGCGAGCIAAYSPQTVLVCPSDVSI